MPEALALHPDLQSMIRHSNSNSISARCTMSVLRDQTAMVLVQAANNAHLQQMTAGEKTLPGESKHTMYHETGRVMGISKEDNFPEGMPGAAGATERNAAARHRQPGVTYLPGLPFESDSALSPHKIKT